MKNKRALYWYFVPVVGDMLFLIKMDDFKIHLIHVEWIRYVLFVKYVGDSCMTNLFQLE